MRNAAPRMLYQAARGGKDQELNFLGRALSKSGGRRFDPVRTLWVRTAKQNHAESALKPFTGKHASAQFVL